MENAEEIAAVEGIAGLMFGPGDFMIDAGMDIGSFLNGNPDPKFLEYMGKFSAVAAKNNVPIFGYVTFFVHSSVVLQYSDWDLFR